MDPMLSAIKAKRMSKPDENTMMGKGPEAGAQESDMMGFVQSLSDEQRKELMNLLAQGSVEIESEKETEGIDKGAPTPKERKIIASKAEQDMAEEEGSDEIAMSMLDRDSLRKAEQGMKPRGLGDRAKMAMAMKLKEKGVVK